MAGPCPKFGGEIHLKFQHSPDSLTPGCHGRYNRHGVHGGRHTHRQPRGPSLVIHSRGLRHQVRHDLRIIPCNKSRQMSLETKYWRYGFRKCRRTELWQWRGYSADSCAGEWDKITVVAQIVQEARPVACCQH